jgi:hypothetical protein
MPRARWRNGGASTHLRGIRLDVSPIGGRCATETPERVTLDRVNVARTGAGRPGRFVGPSTRDRPDSSGCRYRPQVPAASSVAITGVGSRRRPGSFTYRVGQGLEVIRAGRSCLGFALDEHDRPAAGDDEPVGMRGAQVVRMRLGVWRKRPENGGGLGVRVRQGRDGRRRAGRPRAAPGLHFWNASRPGRSGPSPQAMCRIVSGDPGRRTLVAWPIRPAVPPEVPARQPMRRPPRRGTRRLPDGRRGRVLPAGGDGTAAVADFVGASCHRNFRCT